jgi:hypothetical protein
MFIDSLQKPRQQPYKDRLAFAGRLRAWLASFLVAIHDITFRLRRSLDRDITIEQAKQELLLLSGPNHSQSTGGSTMATALNTTSLARFDNMSSGMLADVIGELDCQSKALEAELKAAKDALKARGADKVDGSRFSVTFSASIRQTLDTAAVKAEMGPTWFDDHSKLAEVATCRVSVNKAALAIAA